MTDIPNPRPLVTARTQDILSPSSCLACMFSHHTTLLSTTHAHSPTASQKDAKIGKDRCSRAPRKHNSSGRYTESAHIVTTQSRSVPVTRNHNGAVITSKAESRTSEWVRNWVRPLGYCETLMTKAHEYGCMTTLYSMSLDSRQAINLDLIRQTSCIMFRKMQHLRVVVKEREQQQPWWYEMEQQTVDVDEVIGSEEDVMEQLLRRRYKLYEGPLWFVRFLHLSDCDDNQNKDKDKYKYVCFFGFHHSVSDGTTNMAFCRVFLQVLNDLLKGLAVDMGEVGHFAVPLQDSQADLVSSRLQLFCELIRRFFLGVLAWGFCVRNFTRLFPMPTMTPAATCTLHHELDENTTLKLSLRCKMEGVTVNSAFTAAANLALYRLLIGRQASLGATRINCIHVVNMRRYWPQQLRCDAHGCHISMMDVCFLTDRRHLDEFWQYCRGVHAELRRHLEVSRTALVVQPISRHLNLVIGFNWLLDQLGATSSNDNHYTVTNMGNLSKTFSGSGSEVEATRLLRTVSCHFMPTLCQHTLQTFRGRLSYSLDYYTQKLTRETASQYARGIMHLLTSSIHTPN